MNATQKVQRALIEPGAAEPHFPRAAPPPLWLQWGAGALALALGAMLLFMRNTIADRVDTIIQDQNAAALKLSAKLQYFEAYRVSDDKSMPPGVFAYLVDFSRNTAIMMDEVDRLTLSTTKSHSDWRPRGTDRPPRRPGRHNC